MNLQLSDLIFVAGILQLSVLVASALVPFRLDWKHIFQSLPKLHQQMYWTYGGYVVMAIITLGLLCLCYSEELASGEGLARGVCLYGLVFWGVRVALQPFLDVKEHLTTWWLKAGYHTLTVLFLYFTVVYGWAVLRSLV